MIRSHHLGGFSTVLRKFSYTSNTLDANQLNSKDMSQIDDNIAQVMSNFAFMASRSVTIVMVITFFSPWFLLALFPIGLVYRSVTQFYLNSSREMKRLDSLAMSPVISQFSETLNGASTVRAYGLGARFMAQNGSRVDMKSRCFYYLWAANRWLCL